ncbi:hypothetical protein L0V05_07930 [Tabrizicola sp. J26]|uniref:calcium-binding protein n=1 Tax=Alitabrizicola rongguiensis TaxID=2909234 RepID=UPI001F31C603|nr:calcium-binding protein [Tabrizicola rongguiensis]MCF1708741.1 hypothetical protein [Tabrizicola rongguiensis]
MTFRVVGTFLDGPGNLLSGITDMEVMTTAGGWQLFTATRPGGGVLSIAVGEAAMTLTDQEAIAVTGTLPAPAHLDIVMLGTQTALLYSGANDGRLNDFALGGDGSLGSVAQIKGSPAGAVTAQVTVDLGSERFLYTSRMGASVLTTSHYLSNGRMEEVGEQLLNVSTTTTDITALASVALADGPYLLALSAVQNAVLGFRIGADGLPVQVTSLGASGGLGISAPSAIETATFGAKSYAIVSGTGSSSLSVIEIGAGGSLSVVDHVIDSLDTRFQGVQALDVVTIGGRVFVFAGGGDDGINVFVLLPEGRLILLDTVLQAEGLTLSGITAIEAAASGGTVEVFVATEAAGITRLHFDPGSLAPIKTGGATADRLTGDARGDLISGGAGADTVDGGAGADILMDGLGSDVMTGGAGADWFVLAGDGASDRISDFDPTEDRLDLTAWGRVYDISAIEITTTATGAILRFGGETLVLDTADGSGIPGSAFSSGELFTLTHVVGDPVVAGMTLTGTAGNDTQKGAAGDDVLLGSPGADRMEGAGGFDYADYSMANGSMRVDLLYPALNTNLAAGDVHVGIEGLIGGAGPDNLRGTLGSDVLRGGANVDWLFGRKGDDVLDGGIGDDVLLGGAGQDTLSGGEHRDRAQYSEALAGVTADLLKPQTNTGEAMGDVYVDIEDLAGSSFDDRLSGDSGANRLFGRDGSDLLSGRNGADYLNGGSGRDTLDGGPHGDTLRGGTQADLFIFNGGSDVIEDFRPAEGDRLQIDDTIFGPGWTSTDLVQAFAHVEGRAEVFDFGFGNSLTLEGNATLTGLAGYLEII